MSERHLHPAQRQYIETLAKIKAHEMAMEPMLQEKSRLFNARCEAEAELVSWFERHFKEVASELCHSSKLEIASHIDAYELALDECVTDENRPAEKTAIQGEWRCVITRKPTIDFDKRKVVYEQFNGKYFVCGDHIELTEEEKKRTTVMELMDHVMSQLGHVIDKLDRQPIRIEIVDKRYNKIDGLLRMMTANDEPCTFGWTATFL